jgi:hypothetical protein
MRRLALALLFLPSICFGITKEENTAIYDVVEDCYNIHYYSQQECFEVLLSMNIEIPEWLLCNYLPQLRGCPNQDYGDGNE